MTVFDNLPGRIGRTHHIKLYGLNKNLPPFCSLVLSQYLLTHIAFWHIFRAVFSCCWMQNAAADSETQVRATLDHPGLCTQITEAIIIQHRPLVSDFSPISLHEPEGYIDYLDTLFKRFWCNTRNHICWSYLSHYDQGPNSIEEFNKGFSWLCTDNYELEQSTWSSNIYKFIA